MDARAERNAADLRDRKSRARSIGALAFLCLLAALLMPAVSARAGAALPMFVSADPQTRASQASLPSDAVSIFKKKDGYYLFLPAGWDADRLTLLDAEGGALTIDGDAHEAGDTLSLTPGERYVMASGDTAWDVTVLQSALVPAVFIATDRQDISAMLQDKTVREHGLCSILNADGTLEYDGPLDYIRTRGNSTHSYPKKPFQIKLAKSTSLFGMEKSKKWVFLANYADKSLIRNTIALDLARYADVYAYVPETQAVDLFLNHQYYGSFLLTEKCEIASSRLDISDLEERNESLNEGTYPAFGASGYAPGAEKGVSLAEDPDDITGGYLILATIPRYFERETSGFVTDRGQSFTIDQPKEASPEEVAYIHGVMQRIEDALFSDDWGSDAAPRWADMLDETTFIHRYILAEVLADNDGSLPYFYKDADGNDPTVYCAPVWDQDNILGANLTHADPARSYIRNDEAEGAWFAEAMRHDAFAEKAAQIYRDTYEPALQILLGERTDPYGCLRSIEEYGAEVAGTAALDNVRWRIAAYRPKHFNMTGDTPEENIEFLRAYIAARKAFLDEEW